MVPTQVLPVPSTPPDRLALAADRGELLCSAIAALVAASFAVSANELRAGTRRASAVAFARQGAMYLAHVTAGLSYTEVGRGFGRDRTTAAHACGVVEERRENPRIDALFCVLEAACARLVSPQHGVQR